MAVREYRQSDEDLLVETKVAWFKTRGHGTMTKMMLDECREQFIDMARGSTGECTEQGNIRKEYYAGYPDSFFQKVCIKMCWEYGR